MKKVELLNLRELLNKLTKEENFNKNDFVYSETDNVATNMDAIDSIMFEVNNLIAVVESKEEKEEIHEYNVTLGSWNEHSSDMSQDTYKEWKTIVKCTEEEIQAEEILVDGHPYDILDYAIVNVH